MAAWVFQIFLLRFLRTGRPATGLPLIWLVGVAGGLFWVVQLAVPLTFLTFIGVLSLASGCLVPFAVDRFVSPRLGPLGRLLAFPAALTATAFLLGTYNPFGTAYGLLAVTQHANLALLQVLSAAGPYAISFLIGVTATAANHLWEHGVSWRTARPAFAVAALLGLVLVGGQARLAFFPASTAPTVRVAGVNPTKATVAEAERRLGTDIGDHEAVSRVDAAKVRAAADVLTAQLFADTRSAARSGAKIVFWSENAQRLRSADEPAFLAKAAELAGQEHIYLSVAANVYLPDAPYGRDQTVLFGPDGTKLWTYQKRHPIPGLEPYKARHRAGTRGRDAVRPPVQRHLLRRGLPGHDARRRRHHARPRRRLAGDGPHPHPDGEPAGDRERLRPGAAGLQRLVPGVRPPGQRPCAAGHHARRQRPLDRGRPHARRDDSVPPHRRRLRLAVRGGDPRRHRVRRPPRAPPRLKPGPPHHHTKETSMGKLDGRTALVTGAGRGIGREIALKLAADGAGVVFGGVDIIVNNAGYTWDSVIQKMTDEQWDAMLGVHLTAPFRILRAAQPVIAAAVRREREAGQTAACRKVVNVSSVAGLVGRRSRRQRRAAQLRGGQGRRHRDDQDARQGMGPVQRHGQHGGVRLHPYPADRGGGRRGRHHRGRGPQRQGRRQPRAAGGGGADDPLGRTGTPEEAAGAVYLLCTPESDYVSGQTLVCGGGMSL
ncbi:SDR family oxidoreductase [Actinomadura madurae]|nr:SDR family oxidoreductase [Actinomadura madurae]MCP9971119.1 SDR family oxidoreductase [Actinomadura madurae]